MRIATLALVLLSAGVAHAYTIESPVSVGCHERITEEALRFLRAQGFAEPLPVRSNDDQALLDDLPFDLPGDMQDIASAALLIGVRRPDIRENSDVDITALALIHGDPSRQDDHCLRAPKDDEPDGSIDAIDACRASVRVALESAAEGLLEDGSVDPFHDAHIELTLPLRSKVTVDVPRFWVNLGQALHTLQDGYSHTFRDDDVERVTTVLNWVDYVEEVAEEERDGPEHRAELDECVNIDERRQARLERATNASVALMLAMLDGDPPGRVDGATQVLNDATSPDPSCGFDNQWCATADDRYAATTSCAQAGASAWLVLAALVLFRRGIRWDRLVKCSSSP